DLNQAERRRRAGKRVAFVLGADERVDERDRIHAHVAFGRRRNGAADAKEEGKGVAQVHLRISGIQASSALNSGCSCSTYAAQAGVPGGWMPPRTCAALAVVMLRCRSGSSIAGSNGRSRKSQTPRTTRSVSVTRS